MNSEVYGWKMFLGERHRAEKLPETVKKQSQFRRCSQIASGVLDLQGFRGAAVQTKIIPVRELKHLKPVLTYSVAAIISPNKNNSRKGIETNGPGSRSSRWPVSVQTKIIPVRELKPRQPPDVYLVESLVSKQK